MTPDEAVRARSPWAPGEAPPSPPLFQEGQASPTVSNIQAAMASCGLLAPRSMKSKAG